MSRILRLKEVLLRTGLSRSTLYNKIAKSEFPAQFKLSDNGRAVGFLEEEVEDWIRRRASKGRLNRSILGGRHD